MRPGDVARVLAKAAAFDNRTIGEADVAAWHEVIGHLELPECLEAVTAHYREHSHRVMPADVRKLATNTRVLARAAEDRRARAIRAAEAEAPRTGKAMCTFVLTRLREAGQRPELGIFLGRARAADIAEEACREWLASTAPENPSAAEPDREDPT